MTTMPWISTVVSNAASPTSVAGSQTPGGAGNLTLTASPVTFGSGATQKVTLISTGNLSARTFIVTGTDVYGQSFSESIAGPNNNTVTTTNYFKSVVSVSIDAAAGAALTVGNAADSIGQSYIPDMYSNPFSIGMGCVISGSPTYSIQHTFFDTIAKGVAYTSAVWFTHSVIAGKTANQDGNYDFPVYGVRLLLTAAGSVTVRLIQSGQGAR